MESKSLSIYNNYRDIVEKDRKKYIFDIVLDNSIEKIQLLYNRYKHKFTKSKRTEIENIIKDVIDIKIVLYKINLLSYNYNKLIQNTWNKRYDIKMAKEISNYSSSDDDDTAQTNIKFNLDISDSDD